MGRGLVPPFVPVVSYLPEFETNEWRLIHFTTDEEEVKKRQLMSFLSFSYGEYYDLVPGTYVRLSQKHWVERLEEYSHTLVMTDTPMERRTNLDFIRRAHGRVFVGGLGVGMVLAPLLADPNVESVTVVEKSASLIELVEPHVRKLDGGEKLRVVCADIFEYRTEELFNTIWFDIWPEISTDNLPEMARLHQRWKYRKDRSDPDCFMGSWRQDYLRREMR